MFSKLASLLSLKKNGLFGQTITYDFISHRLQNEILFFLYSVHDNEKCLTFSQTTLIQSNLHGKSR